MWCLSHMCMHRRAGGTRPPHMMLSIPPHQSNSRQATQPTHPTSSPSRASASGVTRPLLRIAAVWMPTICCRPAASGMPTCGMAVWCGRSMRMSVSVNPPLSPPHHHTNQDAPQPPLSPPHHTTPPIQHTTRAHVRTSTCTSRRPGRSTASSIMSLRLVSPMTKTFSSAWMPSSLERSWFTTCLFVCLGPGGVVVLCCVGKGCVK